jgi:membrane-bound inhibitor of C-type lysozyme
MLDSAFDYPLTVKVRVNNNWQTVTARQNSVSVDAKLITHNGDKYVLVKAVPDKGDVVLTNSLSPSGSR